MKALFYIETPAGEAEGLKAWYSYVSQFSKVSRCRMVRDARQENGHCKIFLAFSDSVAVAARYLVELLPFFTLKYYAIVHDYNSQCCMVYKNGQCIKSERFDDSVLAVMVKMGYNAAYSQYVQKLFTAVSVDAGDKKQNSARS